MMVMMIMGEVLTIVSAREDSIMLTMLPSGYNINRLQACHCITECVGGVGGDAMAGAGPPPHY